MTTSAPRLCTNAVSRADAVATTRAPRQRASCTAKDPTPPGPPWIRTLCPAARCACSKSPCQAVSAESGSAAALCVLDAARLQSQIDRPHCRELSSRAVTRKISKSIDFVADPKISYISRHPLHHPRNLMPRNARDSWRPGRVLIGLVPGQFRGRDASGTHLHQHIPTSDLRQWCILEKYLFRPAPAMSSDGFHENPSLRS